MTTHRTAQSPKRQRRAFRGNIFLSAIALIGIGTTAASSEFDGASVPTVYQDDYITVRAGISQLGTQSVHVGDALSLLINLEFDGSEIQIEKLDEEVFQRAFSSVRGIRLHAPSDVVTTKLSRSRTHVTARWHLQVVDCPNDMTSCPGSKAYELPTMTISYQVMDSSGRSANGRSARFTPWPGKIDVAPAIAVTPQAGMAITDVLPGGAYAKPIPIRASSKATMVLLLTGALLLAGSLYAAMSDSGLSRVAPRTIANNSRWQQIIPHLRDESLADEQWSDLLRRCVTWYCMDELNVNPYTYVGISAQDGDKSETRDLFLDVLQQHGIEPNQRADFLNRLFQVTGLTDLDHAETPSA